MFQNAIERVAGFIIQLNEPLVSRVKNWIRRGVYTWGIEQTDPALDPPTYPIKVAFLVYYPSMWPSLQTIYEKMRDDDQFAPTIVTLPTLAHGVLDLPSNEANFKYFSQIGAPVLPGYDAASGRWLDLRTLQPDFVFVMTPYDAYPMYRSRDIRRYARLCYVPYGIMSAKIQDNQFNKPFHYRCWRIFCETPFHKELFQRYSGVDPRKILVTGYPKLDWYRRKRPLESHEMWRLAADSPMKRVIWAPHWSIPLKRAGKHWLNFSTFHQNHRYFLDTMRATASRIQWLFKPHPSLAGRVVRAGLMTETEFQDYQREMLSLPNVIQCRESEYMDYFATSDALITCSVSFLSEYLPTTKPILRLDNRENVRFNEFGEKLVEHYYCAGTTQEIDQFLANVVLKGEDTAYARRMQTLREVMYVPDHHIGESIKEHIKTAVREMR
jgi:hypothetical protein